MGGLGLELPEKAKGSKAEQTRDGHTRGLAGSAALALLLPCCGVFPLGLGFPTGTKGGREDP